MKKKSTKNPSWSKIGKDIGAKIEKECNDEDCKSWHVKSKATVPGCGGAVYGLGFLGALFYYLTTAPTLLDGIIGVLKAIVWPAVIVYEIMSFLGM